MDAEELLEVTRQYRDDFTSVTIEKLQLLTICLLEVHSSLIDTVDRTPELQDMGYVENMELILSNMGKTVSKHISYLNDTIQYKVALGLHDSLDNEKIMYFDLKMIESLYYRVDDNE